MSNETPGADTRNTVSADNVGAVVQAQVINGGVVMRDESAYPQLVLLEAAKALDSRSPIRETAAMSVLMMLLSANKEMFVAIVVLVRTWCGRAKPTQARAHAATKLMFTALPYSWAEPDVERQHLMGELIATVLSFRHAKALPYRFLRVAEQQEDPDGLSILVERPASRCFVLTVSAGVPF